MEPERVALLEHVLHVVRAEELQVPLQGHDVGEGVQVVAEVRGVVPEVEHVRLARPAADVLHEVDVALEGTHVERLVEVALDGAEARHHVVPQARLLRRLARVLVGERLDDRVGMIASG